MAQRGMKQSVFASMQRAIKKTHAGNLRRVNVKRTVGRNTPQEATIATIKEQVLEELSGRKKDFSWLGPQYNRSRSSIATGLMRRGAVTYVNERYIVIALEALEAEGKVSLPPRNQRLARRKAQRKN